MVVYILYSQGAQTLRGTPDQRIYVPVTSWEENKTINNICLDGQHHWLDLPTLEVDRFSQIKIGIKSLWTFED